MSFQEIKSQTQYLSRTSTKLYNKKTVIDENPKNIEEIFIPPDIKQIEKSIIKLKHYKISKLFSDSFVSKFVTKNVSK